MDYKEKYNKLVKAIKVLQETNPSDEGIQNWVSDNVPELAESEDELTWLTKYIEEEAYSLSMDIRDNEDRIKLKKLQKALDWLEKQGQSKKTSIWKHWKDGVAGGSEGEQIFLIKSGLHYSISSCLGYECDYIELSELDKLSSQEKQGQKPAWDERDESHLIHCVRLINNAEGCSISEQENAIVWLKAIKNRIKGE